MCPADRQATHTHTHIVLRPVEARCLRRWYMSVYAVQKNASRNCSFRLIFQLSFFLNWLEPRREHLSEWFFGRCVLCESSSPVSTLLATGQTGLVQLRHAKSFRSVTIKTTKHSQVNQTVYWHHRHWTLGLALVSVILSNPCLFNYMYVTTLGKLFTCTCLCPPSSISWYQLQLGHSAPQELCW